MYAYNLYNFTRNFFTIFFYLFKRILNYSKMIPKILYKRKNCLSDQKSFFK